MRRFLSNSGWQWLASLLFAVAVFWFWWRRYPHALAYQEQWQLFLFDGGYFVSRLREPGGLARYVAEFLVQFYNHVALGAALLSLLLMLVQRLCWRLMVRVQSPSSLYALSFLPPFVLWYMLGDESLLLSFVVSLLVVLLVLLVWPRGRRAGLLSAVLLVPVAYWVAGPVVVAVAVGVLLLGLCRQGVSWLPGAVALFCAVSCVVLSSWWLPYPLSRLFVGLHYYRFPSVLPLSVAVLLLLCVLLPVAVAGLRRLHSLRWGVALALGMVVTGGLLVPRGFDARKYELMAYDYLVRLQQWQAVVSLAERHTPDLPMSVCATNLALGMTGQLGDRAFQFYQRGSQGLLPPFERNFTSIAITGEAYWQLGLVNTAQRFAFESMEALPDYSKSCRMVKRLAETNLVCGNYDVARKYLHLLRRTMFYSRWAQRTEKLMASETAINAHPVYGRLRACRLADDFLFSEPETDKILGQLFLRNPSNQLAMQYLMLCPLLDADLPRFMQYFGVVRQHAQYYPSAAREGVALYYYQQRQQPPAGLVPDLTLQQLNHFMQAFRVGSSSAQLQPYRHTLWNYLLVR